MTKWGVHVSFPSAELVPVYGQLGFQWLFLDAERHAATPSSSRAVVQAAKQAGLICLVRLKELERSVIEEFLDVGVLGFLAPHVSTAEEAAALVAAVKGRPGTFTTALVETQGGIDHLEAIAATPGVDFLAIGPNDLARSLGIREGAQDARVRAIVEAAQARIRAAGKPQLAAVRDAEQARQAKAAGATMIAVSDVALMRSAGRSFLEDVSR